MCPASLVLPRTVRDSQRATDAADWGTVCHAWVETGFTDNRTLLKKIRWSGIERAKWWPRGEHEVTYALNLRTLELRKYDGPREDANVWKARFYGKPEWLTGTIDYRGKYRGRPWVDDLKTGRWPQDYRKPQLRSYQLFTWVEEGRPKGEVYHRSITHWPMYPLGALPERTGLADPLTSFDMDLHLDDLRWAVDHPDEVNPEPFDMGPWDPNKPISVCAFCPCRADNGAEWLGNYRYRAAQHCWPGLMKRLEGER